MKALFLPVYWDQGFTERLEMSIELAKRLDGHLICAIAGPVRGKSRILNRVIPEDAANDLAIAGDLEGSVNERFAESGVSWSWVRVDALHPATLATAARLSDLLIIPTRWSISIPEAPRPSDLMTLTSAPALAIPNQARPLPDRPRVILAWDGSTGAAAALRAAIPLLHACESITALTVGEEPYAGVDPVEYLGWHGIAANAVRVPRKGSICDTLLAEVQTRASDLLVMGAYGRPKWVEEMFGGVTASMLTRSAIPILLKR